MKIGLLITPFITLFIALYFFMEGRLVGNEPFEIIYSESTFLVPQKSIYMFLGILTISKNLIHLFPRKKNSQKRLIMLNQYLDIFLSFSIFSVFEIYILDGVSLNPNQPFDSYKVIGDFSKFKPQLYTILFLVNQLFFTLVLFFMFFKDEMNVFESQILDEG